MSSFCVCSIVNPKPHRIVALIHSLNTTGTETSLLRFPLSDRCLIHTSIRPIIARQHEGLFKDVAPDNFGSDHLEALSLSLPLILLDSSFTVTMHTGNCSYLRISSSFFALAKTWYLGVSKSDGVRLSIYFAEIMFPTLAYCWAVVNISEIPLYSELLDMLRSNIKRLFAPNNFLIVHRLSPPRHLCYVV